MDSVERKLSEVVGFSEFRAGQREVVDHLLVGRSAAAVFPTGSGKSLCYQLPARLLLPDDLNDVVDMLYARSLECGKGECLVRWAELAGRLQLSAE
ncbi:MAG: ATP-dependent DNA helicase RecQ [Planctomycetes bacterium]|nr:ATP-dependent DNA helicase RecQ [Planctomycetota bacterium]